MLVLTRKLGQRLMIGDNIVVTVLSVRGGQVRLGIEAPRSVPIRRDELPTGSVRAADEPEFVVTGKEESWR